MPKRLVGGTGLHGAVPPRLAPVFRDRDELSSASDLSGKIKEALDDSESLVVICSPRAARSLWVNEEIRYFRSLGKEDRIYCVIVDGDLQASDPERACFPPALLESEHGQVAEPLAADARKWADGKQLAKLKLMAGILGIRLDELRQREQLRKRRLQTVGAIAIFAVAALVFFTIQSRIAERDSRLLREAQQASAENMLTQFLEQTERLGDVADLETRKAFGEVMSSYLTDLDPADLTLESRRQLGVALSNRGVILRAEGNLGKAMDAFRGARETLQLLVNDAPGDSDALFELSQAEYWVGQVHIDLGQLRQADIPFKAYAKISDSLHRLEPDNADWIMEAAYAQSNLGALEKLRSPSDPLLILEYSKAALEFNEKAAALDAGYQTELADSFADLAEAWLDVCDMSQAMISRLRNVELAAIHANRNPASNSLKEDYAYALAGLSWVQQQAGQVELALDGLLQSLDLLIELVREDSSNLEKSWDLVLKSARKALLLDMAGRSDDAWNLILEVDAEFRELVEQDQTFQVYNAIEFGMFLTDFAYLAYRRSNPALAERLMTESISQLSVIALEHPDNKKVLYELTMSYFYYWNHNDATLPDDSVREWLEGVKSILNIESCSGLNVGSRLSVMAGDRETAREYSTLLLDRGYREPEFMRFCRANGLCGD